MKLITKEIEKKLHKQYQLGSDMDNQNIVLKLFCPWNQWTWYVMNVDPADPAYAWGIVRGVDNCVEVGSFSIPDLETINGPWGLKIERDRHFKPMNAGECFNQLNEGKHI